MEVPEPLSIPLVMAIACGRCGCQGFVVGAIEPGYLVACGICTDKHDKGIILRCANCGLQACGEAMYQLYLSVRERLLQRPD